MNLKEKIFIGGLAGESKNGNFENIYLSGNIEGSRALGGGLGAGPSSTFTNVHSAINIEGSGNIGGLSGGGNLVTFINSFVTGNISGNDGDTNTGGISGFFNCGSTYASDSYYDTNTTGQNTSKCGEGKTTAELQNPTSNTGIYANWDISVLEFWNIK